jgi:hypothetical protein
MTKADIIKRISEEQGIDQKTVALVIEGFMKCVKDALGKCISTWVRHIFFKEKGCKEGTEYPAAHNDIYSGS